MQQRAVKTKNKILKTAQKLFARHGYHATTVDSIADKANVNKQRIYAYYQNKAKLFESCLLDAFEEINQQEKILFDLIKEKPGNMSEIILTHYMTIHQNHPDFWRLIAWANLEHKPFFKSVKNINKDILSHLRTFYKEGKEKKIFPEKVSFEVYMFVLYAISYFYHSNRKTLTNTLNAELFSNEGMHQVITETVQLLAR